MRRPEPPFRAHHGSLPRVWLYAVVVAGVVVGALVGLIPRWPGLVQEVALPPLDFLADVRVLMARAPSVPVFAVEVVAALVVRAAVLATVLGFSRRRFTFAVRFYLAALVPALLASGLDFSGRAILYAYLIWAGLLIVIATFFVLGAAPWVGRDALHRASGTPLITAFDSARWPSISCASRSSATSGVVPGSVSQVIVVPLSGVLTAFTARRSSSHRATGCRSPSSRSPPSG